MFAQKPDFAVMLMMAVLIVGGVEVEAMRLYSLVID